MGCKKRAAIVVAGGTLAATAQVTTAGSRDACSPGNGIEHVVGLQFDNVHFTRTTPTCRTRKLRLTTTWEYSLIGPPRSSF